MTRFVIMLLMATYDFEARLSVSKIICNDCLNRFNVAVSLSSELESGPGVMWLLYSWLMHSYACRFLTYFFFPSWYWTANCWWETAVLANSKESYVSLVSLACSFAQRGCCGLWCLTDLCATKICPCFIVRSKAVLWPMARLKQASESRLWIQEQPKQILKRIEIGRDTSMYVVSDACWKSANPARTGGVRVCHHEDQLRG